MGIAGTPKSVGRRIVTSTGTASASDLSLIGLPNAPDNLRWLSNAKPPTGSSGFRCAHRSPPLLWSSWPLIQPPSVEICPDLVGMLLRILYVSRLSRNDGLIIRNR